MTEDRRPKTVYFLVGPTAVGKSKIGITLAKRLKGEIISADSMQIYRGMDIGTAKPSRTELKKIPHHLIDLILPSRLFSVYQFRKLALKKIKEIIMRHKTPIIVGGTGLYVRALLEGLSSQPGPDARLRTCLEKEAKTHGIDFLYQRLSEKNPQAANRINRQDKKRIIRALEIVEQSGGTLSDDYEKKVSLAELGYHPVVIGITQERAELYQKIEKRVDQMFKKGLLKEAARLACGRISKTARQALGYKEIWNTLIPLTNSSPPFKGERIKGEGALSQLKELIKRNTRRFAKRQMTWFRREKGIRWVMRQKEDSVEIMCEKILKEIQISNIKNQNDNPKSKE